MKIIAVTNNKGGVGKTHTAFHLAGAYAEDGKRVLLLDLDPSGNLTSLFLPKETRPSLFDVLVEEVPLTQAIHPTNFDGISIVPSNPRLVNLDAYLHDKLDGHTRLSDALREMTPAEPPYDVAILDCPPSLGILTRNALTAAQRVVVPIEPAKFSAQGLDQLLETIEATRRMYNGDLEVAGILLSRFISRRGTQQTYDRALRERELRVFRTKIKDSSVYAKAIEVGRPITDYLSRSEFANAFRDLVEELDHAYAQN